MTVDLDALWDFADPSACEARFLEALAVADGDDAFILRTQIARTWGLRREFDHPRALLDGIRPDLDDAGPEARARYWLELGRTWASAIHTPERRTADALAAGRDAYLRVIEIAEADGLDGLAIDAVHMMAFVDSDPADQLAWNDRGLEIALASARPRARGWEASLRNNRGMALHELGRDGEALAELRRALALREAQGEPGSTRIARWMVAWVLRHLGRLAEALDIQLALEREWDEAGEPDPFVFEELELLCRALGDEARAAAYAARRGASKAS